MGLQRKEYWITEERRWGLIIKGLIKLLEQKKGPFRSFKYFIAGLQ
jgi:hypothetical protein